MLFLIFITYILVHHLLEVIYPSGFVFIDHGETLKCCTKIFILLGHVLSLTNGLRSHQIFITHIWESMCWVYYKALIMHQFLLTILGRIFPFAQSSWSQEKACGEILISYYLFGKVHVFHLNILGSYCHRFW